MTKREIRELWPNLAAGLRGLELSRLTTLMVSGLLVVGGLLALVVNTAVPSLLGREYRPLYSWATVAVGLVGAVLPWHRWNPRLKLLFPIAAIVLTTLASRSDGEAYGALLAVYPLTFVLAGFIAPPGSSLMLAPAAALTLWGMNPGQGTTALAGLLILVPISTLVGEAVAQLVRRQESAEAHTAEMLRGVRDLARTDDEQSGATRLAALIADVLDADAGIVYLADSNHAGRMVRRAATDPAGLTVGFPDSVHSLDLPDVLVGESVDFATGETCDVLPEEMRSASAVVSIPLRDREQLLLGLAMGVWRTSRWALPAATHQAAELLAQEGGRMVERLRRTERLTREALTDPLTQLANRRTFNRALQTLQPGDAIVIIDIDHFKEVNDTFGHEVGDETLLELAATLRRIARQVDTVARYGGEEFALVLAEADRDGAVAMVERLRDMWQQGEPLVTFSAGIAVYRNGDLVADTFRDADRALYAAKAAGRDRFRVAEPRTGRIGSR